MWDAGGIERSNLAGEEMVIVSDVEMERTVGLFVRMLRIEPRDLCLLGKHSTSS